MKNLFNIKIYIRAGFLLAHIILLSSTSYCQYHQEWLKRFNSGNQVFGACGNKIAIDNNGNIYVAGFVNGETNTNDYALVKYTSSGQQIWARTYNGTGNSYDIVYSLALDNLNNVYITGSSTGSGTALDCVTIKYDTSGNLIWLKSYDYGVNKNEYGRVIKCFNNFVYVCALSINANDKNNFLLIKYDTAGNQLWTKRYFDIDDDPQNMVLDRFGNIYITGTSFTMGYGFDFGIVKYNPDGNIIWETRFDNNNGNSDGPTSIAIDSLDNICITGHTINRFNYYTDIMTVKYDSSGILKWSKVIHRNSSTCDDNPQCIGIDKRNNIYVAGYISESGFNNVNYVTIKYKPNGDTSWVRVYNGPGDNYDVANSLAIDNRCNVFVTGESYGSGTNLDYFTIAYDTTGYAFWSDRYGVPGNQADQSKFITLDNSGNIYITGSSYSSSLLTDILTIKYSNTIGIRELNQNVPADYKLFQNYPNPFNPSTKISLKIIKSGLVTLKIYDICGREITTILNERKSPGLYEVSFDGSDLPSGIYFYKLIINNFTDTKKMILVK